MTDKPEEELIEEIKLLQKRLAELETLDSERKQAEEALRENETRLRTVLETVKEGIIFSDEKGYFEVYNSEMERLTGYSKEEANRSGDFIAFLYPDAKESWRARERLGALLRETREQEFESVIQRKDGQSRHILVYSVVISLQNRKMFLSTFRDITERKRAEDDLRRIKQQMEFILGVTNTGLDIIDANFNMVYIDPEWSKVYGDYKGRKCYEYFMGRSEACPGCGVIKALETKKTVVSEEVLAKEGNRPIQVTTMPFQNEKGEWLAAEVNVDISERKKIEETSRLAQLGNLVSAMAHEVNNPLMIISGNAQLCLMEEIESDTVKNNLKIIVQECRSAKDIIQRLLKFSRPSKGEVKEVDINKSVEAVVSIVEHQFKLVNVEIKRNYLKNLPLISVDEPQMQEVFMNLINNAAEAMPGGGAIIITTSLEGDFLRIDFKDTGCGMSEETKKKLPEPFFTTKEKGTGLGLAVCYGILKAHNGELKFESELNKGATATVLLPWGG
ncbi:MAG: PAS domain S-box protein [Candidatus Omnitrophota bacterium]|nr:PAS domain S-box protein [Candidatus Omnitrophota bacterium]